MTGLQIGLQIVGGIALWLLTGFGLTYLASKYDDTLRHSNDLFVLSTIGWPFFIPFIHIHLFFHEGIPWIKRKWTTFRAPKAANKEEKKIEKIRMCPALKLKKYEELLNRVAKDHNEWYRGREIEIAVTQFERIKNGEPVREAQFQPALDVRPEGQPVVYFGRHNGFEFADAQAVAPAVEAVQGFYAAADRALNNAVNRDER